MLMDASIGPSHADIAMKSIRAKEKPRRTKGKGGRRKAKEEESYKKQVRLNARWI